MAIASRAVGDDFHFRAGFFGPVFIRPPGNDDVRPQGNGVPRPERCAPTPPSVRVRLSPFRLQRERTLMSLRPGRVKDGGSDARR